LTVDVESDDEATADGSAASAAAEADVRKTDVSAEISRSDVNNTEWGEGGWERGWEAEKSHLCSCAGSDQHTRTNVGRLSKQR